MQTIICQNRGWVGHVHAIILSTWHRGIEITVCVVPDRAWVIRIPN